MNNYSAFLKKISRRVCKDPIAQPAGRQVSESQSQQSYTNCLMPMLHENSSIRHSRNWTILNALSLLKAVRRYLKFQYR